MQQTKNNKQKINIFTESDGSFSWRKAGTAIIFFVFAYSVIGYLHCNNFKELPSTYIMLIGLVITFYFTKDKIRNIKI